MKKVKWFILLGFIVLCLGALAGCKPPALQAPQNLKIDEVTLELSWDKVTSAHGYYIDYGGEDKVTVRRTSYSLEELPAGDFQVRVRAFGNPDDFSDSAWSEPIPFHKNEETGVVFRAINNNTEFEVRGLGTATGDIDLGDEFRGKPITSIAASAFASSGNRLTSLKIGKYVKTIGERAFYNCSFLESVTLPDGLESLGQRAFQSCRSLTSITLPEKITKVEDYTFSYCRSLKEVNFKGYVTEIGNYAFSDCDGIEVVNIPDSVTSIGNYAFSSCISMTSLHVSSQVTYIGQNAFYRCSAIESIDLENCRDLVGFDTACFAESPALKSVKLPSGLLAIGDEAFRACSSLDTVSVGDDLQYVGAYAFENTKLFEDATNYVTIGNWIVGSKIAGDVNIQIQSGYIGIGTGAFMDSKCTGVTIPDTVKYVNGYAFAGCVNMLNAVIGSGVVELGEQAFRNCVVLEKVTFGGEKSTQTPVLETIGDYAFFNCTRLENIDLPDTVTSIGTYAFTNTRLFMSTPGVVYVDGWVVGVNGTVPNVTIQEGTKGIARYSFYKQQSLTSIVIPDSVQYVEYAAFYQCDALTSVTLPKGLTSIADYLFYRCSMLSTVMIPETVTSIGRSAFYQCEMLNTIEIPSAVTSIGDYAFYKCVALSNLTIGSGVQRIGQRAFYGCEALTSVTLPEGLRSLEMGAFDKCSNLSTVVMREGIESIGDYAFRGSKLTFVQFPDSLRSIGKYAFRDCASLSSVNFGANLESIDDYAFYGTTELQALRFPNSLKSIGRYVFRGCDKLTSVILPNGIEDLGNYAFYGCNSLTFYVESASEPEGWEERWNSVYRPVFWGCTLSGDKSYVESYTVGEKGIQNFNARNGISAPLRSDGTFVGWSSVNGSEVEYEAENAYNAPVGTTLYAIWG